jgi:hypothetical protein
MLRRAFAWSIMPKLIWARGLGNRRAFWLYVTARRARPQRRARIEVLDGDLQLRLDVGHVHRDFVELSIAPLAEPHERFGLGRRAFDLDHEPPRVRRAVRGMRGQRGEQAHLAFTNDLGVALAVLQVLEHHVALEHVEDLVGRIDVEVPPRVGAADHHRGELRILPDHLVADRGLEGRAVVLDPSPEAKRHERLHGAPRGPGMMGRSR